MVGGQGEWINVFWLEGGGLYPHFSETQSTRFWVL